MKSSVTKIGNSKGIIIPAHLLKQCGFTKEVFLEIKNDTLVISKAKNPGKGELKLLLKLAPAKKSCPSMM